MQQVIVYTLLITEGCGPCGGGCLLLRKMLWY